MGPRGWAGPFIESSSSRTSWWVFLTMMKAWLEKYCLKYETTGKCLNCSSGVVRLKQIECNYCLLYVGLSVQFSPCPWRWFWTSVPSPAFFLSSLSRQELLESTLQSPAKWANTRRSVVLQLSLLSLCLQFCRIWEVKLIQSVGLGEPESENPVLQYAAYTKSTYITCKA